MDLQNIIITSKQPEYKENETLNFFLILVCYVHNYVPDLVGLLNGIGMQQEEKLLYIFIKIIFPILSMGSNIHLLIIQQ